MVGMETREIHVKMPWGALAMKTWNSSDLPPMLVVHGVGDNAGSFDELIPLLSRDFHYVCVDLPGHGFSAPLTAGLPASFMHLVASLQRLVRFFGWPSFSLMGHSFGAHVALVLAASERAQISRLILLDGTARGHVMDNNFLDRCAAELAEVLKLESSPLPQLISYEDALEKMKTRIFPVTQKAAKAMLTRTLIKTSKGFFSNVDPRTYFMAMPHMSASTHLYNCRSLYCPVLIVYPRQSLLLVPHLGSEFHKKIIEVLTKTHPMSKLVYVEGDHCVHCNIPQNVAPVLNQFFKDTKDNGPVSIKSHI